MRLSRLKRKKKRKLSLQNVDVESVMRKLGIAFERRDNELYALCLNPAHSGEKSPSWHIRAESGSLKNGLYNCWACKSSGNLYQLVRMLKQFTFSQALAFVDECKEEEPPKIFCPASDADYDLNMMSYEPGEISLEWKGKKIHAVEITANSKAGIYLLRERMINISYWSRFGLLDWREKGRIIVPVLRDGKMISWVARTYLGHKPKTLAPKGAPKKWEMFNYDGLDFSKRVVSPVEGWVDVIRLLQIGIVNPLGLNGSKVSEYQAETLSRFKEIDFWMDGDKAGEILGDDLAAWFGRGCKINIRVFPEGKDPGYYPPGELKQFKPIAWKDYRRQKNGED